MAEAEKEQVELDLDGSQETEVEVSEDLSGNEKVRQMMTISFKKRKPLHKRGLIGLLKKCAKPNGVSKKLYVMRKVCKVNRNK